MTTTTVGKAAAGVMDEAAAARHRALAKAPRSSRMNPKRREQQATFLEMVRNGRLIKDAVAELGISPHTYAKWRQRYPDFRAQIDEIRLGDLKLADAPYQGDFISFRLHFFGMDTYWHQREIVRAIETAKAQEIVLVLVPPEFGKTTLLEDYFCFRLGNNPDFRILNVSEGQKRTRKVLGRVQRRMTDPNVAGEYIARFGPFHMQGQEKAGKPWAADNMTVYKASHDERDFSLEGCGWRSAIAGTRTDLLVPDDIQSRRSLNLTEPMVETFRQDFLTRPGRTGRTIIVGTRVGQEDFYERLQDEGIVDRVVSLPAADAEGHSLCPEMWPDEDLAKKREKVGEVTWWRNYMQKPQSAVDATFSDVLLDGAFDLTLTVGDPRYPSRVASLDPAITGGNALSTWSYDSEKLSLVDVDRQFNLSAVSRIIDSIESAAQRFGFQDLVVEANSWQRSLMHEERLLDLSRRYGFHIREHVTGKNKLDDDLGVARMPQSFLKGEFVFPGADDKSRERIDPLIRELREWRPDVPTRLRRQDCVMSMWFAWLFWLNRRATMGNPRTLVRAGLPWKPTPKGWQTRKGLR